MTLAQVAGYRKAVYGLPEKNYPVLFQHPQYPHIMILTIPVSSFLEARYMPAADWSFIVERLQMWLEDKAVIAKSKENIAVCPRFGVKDKLPSGVEEEVFEDNVAWFDKYIFFEKGKNIGVSEGYTSGIEPSGWQFLRPASRGDCTGEASMIPALDWTINKNYQSRKNSLSILNGLFNGGTLADNDPRSPTYGSLYFYEHFPAFYGDDNCRAAMGSILASELTENLDYAENILRCFLSILRTTGQQGFRRGRLDNPKSFVNGETWEDYQNEDYIEYRPHYQAYMWAGFLQAYVLTGHQGFIDKAKCAISMTMNVFPKLVWTNGITQEYARLLLPLAFLVQIEDTEEHRSWLRKVTETLLGNMVECGAIREMMGDLEYGRYPAPRSNEEYGTTEAALIQENGDPACDLVYTVNYAFVGLHEAAIATGDEYYRKAENKLADFLCRMQVKSKSQPYLDGCWMRGFDYELWEYYSSSADNGWGGWCVESGWTNTWIAATFGLRNLNRGLLCRKNKEHYRHVFAKVYNEMQIVYKEFNKFQSVNIEAPGAE